MQTQAFTAVEDSHAQLVGDAGASMQAEEARLTPCPPLECTSAWSPPQGPRRPLAGPPRRPHSRSAGAAPGRALPPGHPGWTPRCQRPGCRGSPRSCPPAPCWAGPPRQVLTLPHPAGPRSAGHCGSGGWREGGWGPRRRGAAGRGAWCRCAPGRGGWGVPSPLGPRSAGCVGGHPPGPGRRGHCRLVSCSALPQSLQ